MILSEVRTKLSLTDSMTKPISNITKALNLVINTFQKVSTVSGQAFEKIDTSSIEQATRLIGEVDDLINQNTQAQEQFNGSVRQGVNDTAHLGNGIKTVTRNIKNMIGAYAGMKSIEKLINTSDEITGYEARLNLMVDNSEIDTVKDKIFAVAQSSRGDYMNMIGSVAKLGMLAGNSFSDAYGKVNMDEVIRFQELVNKNFIIGGASATEQASAVYQLTQAMASGRLQGDEYRSIIENAPLLANSIEKYMTKVKGATGSMKEWASEGLLTSDVIKAAVFSTADEVESKFAQIPMTWADVMTSVKNDAVKMFDPILKKINELANNDKFMTVFDNIRTGIAYVGSAVSQVIDLIANGAIWISQNWSWISPILLGVAAAIGIVSAAIFLYNTYTAIKNGLDAISAARSALKSGMTLADAAATKTAAGAQVGLNAAMLACPLTWIIGAIIAVIAILVAVMKTIGKTTGTVNSSLGIIIGGISAAVAFIINIVIGVINAVIQVFNFIAGLIVGIIEWIVNACTGGFDSIGGAAANVVGNIISWLLDLLKIVTKVIDAISGLDLTSKVEDWKSTVLSWGKKNNSVTLSREIAPQINRIGYKDAYSWGTSKGDALNDKIKGFFGADELLKELDLGELGDMNNNISTIASDTSDIKDSVSDTSDDELEYLRMIAERETVNKFTTAEIKLDFTSNATINSDMDIDGLINTFTTELEESLVTTAEGLET